MNRASQVHPAYTSGAPGDFRQATHTFLEEVDRRLTEHAWVPTEPERHAIALWTAASHAQRAWDTAPRLLLNGAEPGIGKTTVNTLLSGLTHRPVRVSRPTLAALLRTNSREDPITVHLSNGDTSLRGVHDGSNDLAELLESGFGRGQSTPRVIEKVLVDFPTFCFICLDGRNLPRIAGEAVMSRSIVIEMAPKPPGMKLKEVRHRTVERELRPIAEAYHATVNDHLEMLEAAEPEMPVENRAKDVWEPLFVMAKVAGGEWPERAWAACEAIRAQAAEGAGIDIDTELVHHLLAVWPRNGDGGPETWASGDRLLSELSRIDEGPWRDDVPGTKTGGLTVRKLALMLRPYRVRPAKAMGGLRGYLLTQVARAGARGVCRTLHAPGMGGQLCAGCGSPTGVDA